MPKIILKIDLLSVEINGVSLNEYSSVNLLF